MADESEYKLFVPTTDNAGQPIRTTVLQDYAIKMAKHFGGVTVYPANGCFFDKKLGLLCDPVIVITATEVEGQREHTDAEDQAFIQSLSQDVGQKLGQRDVLHTNVPEDAAVFVPGQFKNQLPAALLEPGAARISRKEAFRRILPDR